ncbi:hypothetical protein CGCA056_v009023 [Colletotrichum aenigma]|uniref:uncharacterized protein n=1 Tax=Colletotrichum aenigma TaxID=1215731 RepID=UPI001872927F|nr:uncharacterized protein CGCA056_v009023 [Colletotrichum aenigma]KAF5519202.1 hypothetical protein CGCA056_v009023 [Colletotrichum aenigma]
MAFNSLVASLALLGSSLSFLATSSALILIGLHHTRRRSLRHTLVLNLMVAEVINSANNTISGIIYVRDQELQRGIACVLNGVFSQLSTQASDFSILAIAIATLLVIWQRTSMADSSSLKRFSICCCVWLIPITTSALAARIGVIEPVGGNCCWIARDRPNLRLGLTYVWRLWIISTTVCIYTFVWCYLSQRPRPAASTSWLSCDTGSLTDTSQVFGPRGAGIGRLGTREQQTHVRALGERRPLQTTQALTATLLQRVRDCSDFTNGEDTAEYNSGGGTASQSCIPQPWGASRLLEYRWNPSRDTTVAKDGVSSNVTAAMMANLSTKKQTQTSERRIKRMILLKSCPILYIILWMPSLLSGIIETSEAKTFSSVSAALQVSSQFVGLANAVDVLLP